MVSEVFCAVILQEVDKRVVVSLDAVDVGSDAVDTLNHVVGVLQEAVLVFESVRVSQVGESFLELAKVLGSLVFSAQSNLFVVSEGLAHVFLGVAVFGDVSQVGSLHFLKRSAQTHKEVVIPLLTHICW